MSSFPVSENVAAMRSSSTLKAAQAATRLREQGINVIDLSVGEPDFDTPEFVKQYAIEALEGGLTKYTPVPGLAKFRDSIASFYGERFGAEVSPAQVAASCGGKQGLFNAACTILNPGDELLIPKPYWVTFPEIGTFCRARNVFVETEETDFILTADQVRELITDYTKLLIINSPNNPTGRVVPPDEMRRIIEVCAEHDVYVLTDECYLFFAYPPAEVFTSAVLPEELRKYVCVAGSFSKTYAMTGWRIGYTIANDEWTKAMVKLQSHSATHPTSFVQWACAKAMENHQASINAVSAMVAEYERRRQWLIPALNEVEGFKCQMPEGAFYAFVDVRGLLGHEMQTSADVADRLLDEAHIVVTDGAGFGADGFIRISYATSMENLIEAVSQMKALFGESKRTRVGSDDGDNRMGELDNIARNVG
jgi:aspartate aminotransferase